MPLNKVYSFDAILSMESLFPTLRVAKKLYWTSHKLLEKLEELEKLDEQDGKKNPRNNQLVKSKFRSTLNNASRKSRIRRRGVGYLVPKRTIWEVKDFKYYMMKIDP